MPKYSVVNKIQSTNQSVEISAPLSSSDVSETQNIDQDASSAFQFMDLCEEDLDQEINKGGDIARPVLKATSLQNEYFHFKEVSQDKFFISKKLPSSGSEFLPHGRFDQNYFSTLSVMAGAPGPTWKAGTPNSLGARIRLVHTDLNIDSWRKHLIGYEHADLCQLLEFGFPIGLSNPTPVLVSATSNHGSSYSFYPWIDKFLTTGLSKKYMAGPFHEQPFERVHLSPLMTAEKKPDGRRPVFDATYGELSLNNGTPSDQYLGQPLDFTYPKIEDFRRLVILKGKGCFMWKRDLSPSTCSYHWTQLTILKFHLCGDVTCTSSSV